MDSASLAILNILFMKSFRYSFAVATGAAILGVALMASADTGSSSMVSFSADAMNVSCPVITNYMRQGLPNDKAEVTRLQQFLKAQEGFDVDVNGTYDQKTEDAVKAFQKKYADDVLTPWGATRATGTVYITTAKKINQLACAVAMTLNEKELSVIKNYQSGLAIASNHVSLNQPSGQGEDPAVTYTSATAGPDAPQSAGDAMSAEAAAVANASIIGRFWFFLKTLF